MGIINTFPEAQRKIEILKLLENDITPERKIELRTELERMETIIREKTAKVLDDNHSGKIPERIFKNISEECKMDEWPANIKLVKEKVAYIEEELKAKIVELCRGDKKVIVSAVGKVLIEFRNDKKGSKTPTPQV